MLDNQGGEGNSRRGGLAAMWSEGFDAAGRVVAAIALLMATAAVAPAQADWTVYASGDLGYSALKGSVDGFLNQGPGRAFNGNDTTVSPLIGGAVGLAVPMNEAMAWQLPWHWQLPDWRVRAELEAVGLRDYDVITKPIANNTGPVVTVVESWSLMTNFFLDVPLRGLYRPISWTTSRLFGRWRLPLLKDTLKRTTLDVGFGVGVAGLDVTTREDVNRGSTTEHNFAWQVGAGFSYDLTDRVDLTLGYRYIDPGDASYEFDNQIRVLDQVQAVNGSKFPRELEQCIVPCAWMWR